MNEHDSSYKHIFSHPEIVADLLRGFVREDWVDQIDYSSLEKVSGSYVTDDLRDRADDIIWRVKVGGRPLYVYLLIEFQSRVDPWMALRILTYTGLLYQDLIKSEALRDVEGKVGKLPPVFPVVIYNGSGRWTASREVADLIEEFPGILAKYRPQQRHFVLDEGRVGESGLPEKNTLSEIIRIEKSRSPAALRSIVRELKEALRNPRHDSLRRALAIWINRVVVRRLVHTENIPEVIDLEELDAMLAEHVTEWTQQWKLEGEAALLERQLTRRFGPLSDEVRSRLSSASAEQFERWADAILDAKSLAEVFGGH